MRKKLHKMLLVSCCDLESDEVKQVIDTASETVDLSIQTCTSEDALHFCLTFRPELICLVAHGDDNDTVVMSRLLTMLKLHSGTRSIPTTIAWFTLEAEPEQDGDDEEDEQEEAREMYESDDSVLPGLKSKTDFRMN